MGTEKRVETRWRNEGKFRVGDKVTFNGGFPGTVIEIYSPGMIVVRGVRGSVCIGVEDADPVEERSHEV
jgi:preprotein translocase subunit YajC